MKQKFAVLIALLLGVSTLAACNTTGNTQLTGELPDTVYTVDANGNPTSPNTVYNP